MVETIEVQFSLCLINGSRDVLGAWMYSIRHYFSAEFYAPVSLQTFRQFSSWNMFVSYLPIFKQQI
jgi:hypothetical protein